VSDIRNALRVAGDLYWGGSSPASPGSSLGSTRASRFLPNVRTRDITAEEWGGQVVETVYAGEAPVLISILREWDATAVGEVFPQGASPMNVRSGSSRPGALLGETKGGVLYFKPRASSHPGVWFYRAVPLPRDAAELNLAAGTEIGFGVVFRATPDSQGRVYDVGTAAGISP